MESLLHLTVDCTNMQVKIKILQNFCPWTQEITSPCLAVRGTIKFTENSSTRESNTTSRVSFHAKREAPGARVWPNHQLAYFSLLCKLVKAKSQFGSSLCSSFLAQKPFSRCWIVVNSSHLENWVLQFLTKSLKRPPPFPFFLYLYARGVYTPVLVKTCAKLYTVFRTCSV